VETSDRPCGRKSSCLAFGVTGKGEARTALLEGTEAGAAGSIIKASGVGAKDRQRLIQRTAVYGPVRTVVWEGRSREAPPYPDFNNWGRASCSALSLSGTLLRHERHASL
jgi:hypothetical protein